MSKWIFWMIFSVLGFKSFAFDFREEHHLVFFFSSHCPHCQMEAPILEDYAKTHHILVDAYTLDGQGLPEFSKPKIPSQDLISVAFSGQSIQTPAIFILNTKTLALYPLAIGALNFEELSTRISELQAKITGFERGFA